MKGLKHSGRATPVTGPKLPQPGELRLPFPLLLSIGAASALQVTLNYGSLHFKGSAIQSLSVDPSLEKVLPLVLTFVVFHGFSILANILMANGKSLVAAFAYQRAWAAFLPMRIFSKQEALSDAVAQILTRHAPRIFEIRGHVAAGLTSAVGAVALVVYQSVRDSFWVGLAALPIVLLLGSMTTRMGHKLYPSAQRAFNEASLTIAPWLRDYFYGNREAFLNWKRDESSAVLSSWFQKTAHHYLRLWKRLLAAMIHRDLVGSFFVEWPYIFGVGGLLLFTAQGQLTLQQTFVWIGLLELMIGASASLRNLHHWRQELSGLEQLTQKIAHQLHAPTPHGLALPIEEHSAAFLKSAAASVPPARALEPFQAEFRLRDGSTVRLGTAPGLYGLQGANGSGKSTLLDAILGYCTDYDHWDRTAVSALQAHFQGAARIIEKEPVVYSGLSTFAQQVEGPASQASDSELLDRLTLKLQALWNGQETHAQFWSERFSKLALAWNQNRRLSSGERVLLSLGRALIGWNAEQVRLVVSDEAEAFLDPQIAQAFLKLLQKFAETAAVYRVFHRSQSPHARTLRTLLLATDPSGERGLVVPLSIRKARRLAPGNWVEGHGSIGTALAPQARRILDTLIALHPTLGPTLSDSTWIIQGDLPGVRIQSTESAGLALAASFTILAMAPESPEAAPPLPTVAATGEIDHTGAVKGVKGQQAKLKALQNTYAEGQTLWTLTPDTLTHLSELPARVQSVIENEKAAPATV
jgi:ABC-type branched-subunit amino acid transport system ATPase component